jgi:signal transduction histidine kinase
MLERIEHHDTAIRQFSSDASHELKSPIANITALVQTRTSTDPSWGRIQEQLTSEANRLGALVENLLFLATHQDTEQRVERRAVQLDELLFSEAELVSATADVRVAIGRVEPAAVIGSIGDLSRMVRNLVDNAVRHATTRIELSLTTSDGVVVLGVEDDGPGVPITDRQRVFERFTRLDEARARDDGGTGLGLSIVAQVATAHGATVAVGESELGGALFEVTFSPHSI